MLLIWYPTLPMKKSLLFLLMAVAATFQTKAEIQLVSFGSGGFSLSPSSTGSYTQTASGITYSPNVTSGDTFFNDVPFDDRDWSDNAWYLKMTLLSGSPTAVPFYLSLFDSAFSMIDTYDYSTANLTALGVSTVMFPSGISAPGSGNYIDVAYAQGTWGGDGNVNVRFDGIYVLPEPSTYALLAMTAVGAFWWARRRK
jgi:hypothetical protein